MTRTLPAPLNLANETLAFLLELLALGLLGWWGFAIGPGTALSILLGLGLPALAATLWGLYAAPRAKYKVGLPAQLAVKALVFGSAGAALWALTGPGLAAAYAVVVVANTALATVNRRAGGHLGAWAASSTTERR